MKRCVVIVASALMYAALNGCANTKTVRLAHDVSPPLLKRTIGAASWPKADFGAMTAGRSMLGPLGAALVVSEGNQIVEANDIVDPAAMMSAELTNDLVRRYGLKRLAPPVTEVANGEVATLRRHFPTSDLVLDIRTIFWGFQHFLDNPSRYRIGYTSRLQLTDLHAGKRLAEGFCAYNPGDSSASTSPTRDELLANDAERLKREIAVGASFCLSKFRKEILRIE